MARAREAEARRIEAEAALLKAEEEKGIEVPHAAAVTLKARMRTARGLQKKVELAKPPCEHARTAPHQTNGRQSTCQ